MARDYDEEWEKMKAEFLNNRNQKKEKTRPQADWKNNLGNDWKQEATRIFREEQEKEKAQAKLNPTKHYTELSNFDMNNNGFIVENQGVVHILPRVHSHEDYIKRLFPKEFPQYEHEYYAINQLLNQGIRVRASGHVVFVTLTEMPNDEQIKAVERIFNYISSVYSAAWIQIDSMEGFSVLVDKTEDIRPAIQKLLNPRNDREAGIMDWMKPKPKPQVEVERGEFAHPFTLFDENEKQILRNYHESDKLGEITPENLDKFNFDERSLILKNDGKIDLLNNLHHFYIKNLFNSAGKSIKTDFYNIKNGVYAIIHELFEGGIRIYTTDFGVELNITAYQFPTKSQLNMIDLLDEKMDFQRCFCIIYAHINGDTERLAFEGRGELSWYNVRNQIERNKLELQKSQNTNLEYEEGKKLNDTINTFRDPNYGKKEQMPDWTPKPKQMTLTPEQRAHLLKNLKPMTYKEKSAFVQNMTKLASTLDNQGLHSKADMIDLIIKEAQTGKHAYPPELQISDQTWDDFMDYYRDGLKGVNIENNEIKDHADNEKRSWSSSWLLHEDGTLDLLPDHHMAYLNDVLNRLEYDNHYGLGQIKRLRDRCTYLAYHNLLKGTLRVYITGENLSVAGYQAPTQQQIQTLKILSKEFGIVNMGADIWPYKQKTVSFYDYAPESAINELDQINNTLTPEEREERARHQMIQMFRNQFDEAPRGSFLDRQQSNSNLTPEQRMHLLKNLGPMQFRPEKSASANIFRKAQTGKHAHPPFADFTRNLLKKFIKIYNQGLKAKGVNSTDIVGLVDKDTSYSSSWVLHEDGTFDLLPMHHWNYIDSAFRTAVSEFKDTRTTRKNKENFEYFMGNAYKAIHTLFAGALRIYVYYSDWRNDKHLCVAGYQAPTGGQSEALRSLINAFDIGRISTDIELLNKRGLNKYGLSPQEFFNEVQTMNDDPTKEEQENLARHQMIQMFRDQSYDGRIDSPPPIERDKKKLTQEEKNHMIKNLGPMQFRPEKSASIIEVANYFDKKGWYKEADQLMKLSQKGKRGMPKSTGLSDDFRNKFLAQYKIGLSAKNMNPRNFVSYVDRWSSSWIMHEDGTLDLLPQHHSTYMDEVAALIKSNVHPDDYYNYREMDTYRFIYDILEGAMRVYVQGNGISVAAFQAPTPQQIESIETMASFMTNPQVHGSVKMRHENPISFWDQTPDDASRAFWQANEEWSPKDIERNQTMKMFRQHDFDKPLKKEEKEPLTREQIQHLLDNL